jgi:hypothetical protein
MLTTFALAGSRDGFYAMTFTMVFIEIKYQGAGFLLVRSRHVRSR